MLRFNQAVRLEQANFLNEASRLVYSSRAPHNSRFETIHVTSSQFEGESAKKSVSVYSFEDQKVQMSVGFNLDGPARGNETLSRPPPARRLVRLDQCAAA